MKPDFESLISQIKEEFPQVRTELHSFSSGVRILDVWLVEKFFVFEYSPRLGCGVQEYKAEDTGWEGYDYVTEDYSEASSHLLELLRSAVDTANAPNSQTKMAV